MNTKGIKQVTLSGKHKKGYPTECWVRTNIDRLINQQARRRKLQQRDMILVGILARGEHLTKKQIAQISKISLATVSRKLMRMRALLLKKSPQLSIKYDIKTKTYYIVHRHISARVDDVKQQQSEKNHIAVLKVKRLQTSGVTMRNVNMCSAEDKLKYKLAQRQNDRAKRLTDSIKNLLPKHPIIKNVF